MKRRKNENRRKKTSEKLIQRERERERDKKVKSIRDRGRYIGRKWVKPRERDTVGEGERERERERERESCEKEAIFCVHNKITLSAERRTKEAGVKAYKPLTLVLMRRASFPDS